MQHTPIHKLKKLIIYIHCCIFSYAYVHKLLYIAYVTKLHNTTYMYITINQTVAYCNDINRNFII
jgi:hypothetical protein